MNPHEQTDVLVLQKLVVQLLNRQEDLVSELAAMRKELDSALDEIKRLKGEKGRPRFGPSGKKKDVKKLPKTNQTSSDSGPSSESKDSSAPSVDRVEFVDTKPLDLPSDAQFKGYRSVYQKNIQIKRDNVEYKIARWYCPSEGRYYESNMPASYRGQTGSMLMSFVQMLHHCGDMTHGKIRELLAHFGLDLSGGGLSNMLTHSDWIEAERSALLQASIEASPYAQIDSTSSKEKGQRRYTQIICGKYFSLFYSQVGRSRLDVYAALQGQARQEVQLAYSLVSQERLRNAKVSKKHLAYFKQTFSLGQILSTQALQKIFDSEPIFAKTNTIRRSAIAGALAAGYYHQQTQMPRVEYLMSDDGREYWGIASKKQMHCWIHAIRHYRLLNPSNDYFRDIHKTFMDKLWLFYQRMKNYKTLPLKKQIIEKKAIRAQFDQLFSPSTDYEKLNKQIGATQANREQLLTFLDHSILPLHNNAAERGARRIVRKRDISFHTWSQRGTNIRDAFLSLDQTAKKLKIKFLDYILDRNSGKDQIDSMAQKVKNAYRYNPSTI